MVLRHHGRHLPRAALDEARALLSRAPMQHLGAMRSDLPTFQAVVGDAVGRLAVVELACVELASRFDRGEHDARALLPLGLALKQQVATTVPQVLSDLVEAVGAQAYGTASRLGRLWRDAQAARFHPPTRFATNQILGRWRLGRPFTFEVAELPVDRDLPT